MKNRRIYHITHVDNLVGIIADERLWCDQQRIRRKLKTTNIGHQHIKNRRLTRRVPVSARGMLGEYVPFNFCSRSVMLYVIHKGSVEGYSDGQNPIVHLVSSVKTAVCTGRPWAFTNRHAELRYTDYFDSLDDINKVDWKVMPLNFWADNDETKEKRQAEFLVHRWFPWDAIETIVVKTPQTEQRVYHILKGHSHAPDVKQKPSWYY